MALTDKRQAFVNEYVRDWNGRAAAVRAGYSENGAAVTAHRLLEDAEVQGEIKRRVDETAMSTDETLVRLAEQARAAYAPYITAEGGVDLEQLVSDGKAHLIRKVKPTRYGTEIEFVDAQAALFTLARAHGLLGPKGTSDDPTVNVTMSLDEWRARTEARRAQAAETEALFKGRGDA